jgi:hypothetical protein
LFFASSTKIIQTIFPYTYNLGSYFCLELSLMIFTFRFLLFYLLLMYFFGIVFTLSSIVNVYILKINWVVKFYPTPFSNIIFFKKGICAKLGRDKFS